MTYEKPLWLDNASGGYPAGLDRALIAGVFQSAGVFGVTDLAVSQRGAGADSSVDVALGKAIVYEQSTTERAYLIRLTGSVQNVPLPASPGSNSRYDMIYAQVRDSTISGAVDDWVLTAVSGTASASPTEPAAPSGQSLLLARVTRTSGVATVLNAAIQDRRIFNRLAYPLPWVNITSLGSQKTELQPLRVRHRDFEHVEISGVVHDTTAGTVNGDTLFTLPSPTNQPSFFPSTRTARVTAGATLGASASQQDIRADVSTSGVVTANFTQPPSGSYAPDDVYFDGFIYLRAQPA
ncbi:MAG: hypothetical protein ABW046_20640 [Actinoplanes sp.]